MPGSPGAAESTVAPALDAEGARVGAGVVERDLAQLVRHDADEVGTGLDGQDQEQNLAERARIEFARPA